MRFHVALKNIVPKKDAKFTYKFWKELFVGLDKVDIQHKFSSLGRWINR